MHCAARVEDGGSGGGGGGGGAVGMILFIKNIVGPLLTNISMIQTIIFPKDVELQIFLTSKIPLQWGHLALSLRCPY